MDRPLVKIHSINRLKKMKTRARHTIVTYRRSNISTQLSRGHSLRTNLAPRLDVQRQSRSIINATLEGVDDYHFGAFGHAVFALLEFPSRRSLSFSFSLFSTHAPFEDLSTARNNKVCIPRSQMKTKRYDFERYARTVSRFSLLRIDDRTEEEEIFSYDFRYRSRESRI